MFKFQFLRVFNKIISTVNNEKRIEKKYKEYIEVHSSFVPSDLFCHVEESLLIFFYRKQSFFYLLDGCRSRVSDRIWNNKN
jgi:hypothetical protein